ncbi:MAG: 2-polyprenyl-3-methyl-6-methoxy-1,4-benzoquinone monooxygenase [Gammaproteobacteria bacterium]|nr:2-polyprenyl-3-methyl-6-methoxy-1,4-benzoquinone monooxygenase [Gammaproteobacteria bacterium]
MKNNNLGLLDLLVSGFDQALRTATGLHPGSGRVNPASETSDDSLAQEQRRHVAGLMRVNHSGEVAAQALYQGQAMTARLENVRDTMEQAALEEIDHLQWCECRLQELDARPSALNPLWYAGSFAIGALAGMAGDRWSLGFVAETERQVVKHLEDHIERLPKGDERSRAILEQMKLDEKQHGQAAESAGAALLPTPVRGLMTLTARLMTRTSYWI